MSSGAQPGIIMIISNNLLSIVFGIADTNLPAGLLTTSNLE